MKYQPESISTKELIQILPKTGVKIIDVRPVDAYNGWTLQHESRGGHIKGAKSLPVKWTNYVDWIEIVRHKNILTEHELVIYGYGKTILIKLPNALSNRVIIKSCVLSFY